MSQGKIAILVENDYQDQEVWVPLYRLREEGFETVVVGPTAAAYKSKYGVPIQATVAASAARSDDFVAVVIPGGWAPDRLRQDAGVLKLVREMFEKRRLVAAIPHAEPFLVDGLGHGGVCCRQEVPMFGWIVSKVPTAGRA